ncbi:N-acetylmuramoyl-L-alanine amidase [Carboxydocella thermautotrophica]|uniref:N-acetylmuramoyl-L-alanine amidase n=3 Tax=Carboxydocella TaxID=178898 RepID=A0A2R4MY94_CARTR|nr:N-acetylmuramoyl-L-alanine amidase [Carboxydocella thermautotrophica]AVX19812.1 N-acetylmuramoyl-L-alanine amidase [Carboxydocella thermautotrophica]
MTKTRKIFHLLLFISLFWLLLPGWAIASGTATVTGTKLNIRQFPSTTAKILGQVKKGDKLPVFSQKGDWLQVKFGKQTGWVFKSLVSYQAANSQTTAVRPVQQQTTTSGTGSNYATVTGTKLNIRQFPSTTAKILGQVKKGDKLPVLSQKGDWLQVKFGKQTGWVFKSLVSYKLAQPEAKPVNQAPAAVQKTVYVIATTVNLRTGPGTNYAKVGVARQGQELKVVAQQKASDGKIWYKLANNAWVAGWLVQEKPQVTPVSSQPQDKPEPEPVPNLPPAEQGLYIDIRAIKEGDGTRIKVYANSSVTDQVVLEKQDRQWKVILPGAKLLNPFDGAGQSWPGLELLQVQQLEDDAAGVVLTAVYSSVYAPVLIPGQDGRSLEILVGLGRLQGRTIVIDPGHGGTDPGAIGGVLKVKEKDVNLAIAQRVRRYLAEEGAQIIMTREGDTYPTLAERYTLANDQQAQLFVSIHANSNTSSSVYGSATYYNNENRTSEEIAARLKLAQLIQEEILKIPERKAFGANNGVWLDSRGLAVLRGTRMPSVLVETAFLSNPTEEQLLNDPGFQDQIARAIAQGIIRYFTE